MRSNHIELAAAPRKKKAADIRDCEVWGRGAYLIRVEIELGVERNPGTCITSNPAGLETKIRIVTSKVRVFIEVATLGN
jgi:hypothetical protein